ncbi:MAG TPA: carbohydrate porin [Chthoniobacterales bacterium]|jgi:porin|nr:carbohydrate porin [Chthoniobacterales bacterium]
MAKGSAISFIGGTAIAVLLLFCGPSDVRGGAPESSDDQGANTTTYQAWQDHLAGEGITISFQWQADVFGNVRGGSREGAVTDGLVRQDLDLDCQKLTRLAFFDDTEIHVEGIYPYGTDISTLVGDIGGVNNNAAYNSPRLNEIWFQRRFQVGTANSSVRTGLMGADQEFDVNGTGSLFINSSFGAPLGFSGNAPIPTYPFTALGFRVDFSAGNERYLKVNFRSGVYDGNSAAPKFGPFAVGAPTSPAYNKYGVDFHLNPSSGLIFLNELDFDFLSREPSALPAKDSGHWFFGPGHLLFGGFYATNRFENIYEAELQTFGAPGAHGRIREVSGDYGIYVLLEQKFYEDAPGSPNGLFLFGRGCRLPNDRNFITVSVDAGAVYKGIFRRQKESQDSLGIGFVYNSVSDNVRHAVAVARNEGVQGVLNFGSEPVLEATYVLPMTGHWQLQPDLQWVIRPGSSDAFRNALVIGLRSSLTF